MFEESAIKGAMPNAVTAKPVSDTMTAVVRLRGCLPTSRVMCREPSASAWSIDSKDFNVVRSVIALLTRAGRNLRLVVSALGVVQ